jgi:mitochondrial fission protein ELM1
MNDARSETRSQDHPRTWLVIGDKLGDNAQVQIIADALGWPVEVRRLHFLEQYQLGKPRFAASLYHLDHERSDTLEPPWPDLVLTVGRRPSMAALWIREQSEGHTRLVILGRPKRWLDRFELILAPSQFRLPPRPNVLKLKLPLIRIDPERVRRGGEEWSARLASLQKPLFALLVGGETKPFVFDAEVARDLIRRTLAAVEAEGGSLYVTTSRRTPEAVVGALKEGLPAGARMHEWTPGATENPYLGLLDHADRFVVTGDSMSMMIEVARLGKPLAIYALPVRRDPRTRVREGLSRMLHDPDRPGSRLGDLLYRLGLVRYSRDLGEIHRQLIRQGSAVPLGEPFPASGPPLDDELREVVERVRAAADRA